VEVVFEVTEVQVGGSGEFLVNSAAVLGCAALAGKAFNRKVRKELPRRSQRKTSA